MAFPAGGALLATAVSAQQAGPCLSAGAPQIGCLLLQNDNSCLIVKKTTMMVIKMKPMISITRKKIPKLQINSNYSRHPYYRCSQDLFLPSPWPYVISHGKSMGSLQHVISHGKSMGSLQHVISHGKSMGYFVPLCIITTARFLICSQACNLE